MAADHEVDGTDGRRSRRPRPDPRSRRRRLVVVALVLLAPALALASTAAPASADPVGTVDTFPLTGVTGRVFGLIAGPGGTTWFIASDDHAIGRIAADGTVTTFTHPNLGWPNDLAVGPDGNIWFTVGLLADQSGGAYGFLTPSGTFTLFPAVGGGPMTIQDAPVSIEAAADGTLVVSQYDALDGMDLYRVATDGTTTWLAGEEDVGAYGLTLAADGNLWYSTGGGIGFLRPDGTGDHTDRQDQAHPIASVGYTANSAAWAIDGTAGSLLRYVPDGLEQPDIFHDPAYGSPEQVAAGIDDSAWFVGTDEAVRRLTAGAELTRFPTPGYTADDIVAAADGRLWLAGEDGLARLDTDGTFTTIPAAGAVESGLTVIGDHVWFFGDGTAVRVRAADAAVPSSVAATVDQDTVTVRWRAPSAPADPPAAGYQVTASPGGATCATTGATTCAIAGLDPGTSYRFTVRVQGPGGLGASSAPSNPVLAWDGAGFHPLAPVRILDSRVDFGFAGRVVAGTPRQLQVTGNEVPETATAVVLNVTVTDSSAESFLTVSPTGAPTPNASNLNFGAGQVIPNLVTVAVGTGGMVDIATAVGSTHVVADLSGWYDDGSGSSHRYFPMTPSRILDTREANPWVEVVSASHPNPSQLPILRQPQPGYYPPGGTNPAGPPSFASAVVANVTVTNATDFSFLRIWGGYPPGPAVSNLNFAPGQTIANLVVLDLTDGDWIAMANAVGDVDVIIDVVGYFVADGGQRFHAMAPDRVLDTRIDLGLPGRQQAGQSRSLAVAGAPGTGVPLGATALVANVTVADATAESFVSVFPADVARPNPYSNVNFGINQVIPSLTVTGLSPEGSVGPDGAISLYNHLGRTHLVADAVGWYAPW